MQREKRVIAISGMPGAGKGVAAEAAKQLGLHVLVLGDVIREETERRGLDPTPKNVGNVMLQMRAEGGPAAVAKRLLPKIQAIHYSGKKKMHADKNIVLVNTQTQQVSFLGQTLAGSVHDKTAAEHAQIAYPRGTTLRSDLGFLGYTLQVQAARQPKKSPNTPS